MKKQAMSLLFTVLALVAAVCLLQPVTAQAAEEGVVLVDAEGVETATADPLADFDPAVHSYVKL